jgi:DnaJ-class molecular chaperone
VDEEIDLYEVLEITKGASKIEIKKAYHKVRSLRQNHNLTSNVARPH